MTEADVRFHHLIAEASENHALVRAFDQLAPFARTFITLTLPDVDVREIVLRAPADPGRAPRPGRRSRGGGRTGAPAVGQRAAADATSRPLWATRPRRTPAPEPGDAAPSAIAAADVVDYRESLTVTPRGP